MFVYLFLYLLLKSILPILKHMYKKFFNKSVYVVTISGVFFRKVRCLESVLNVIESSHHFKCHFLTSKYMFNVTTDS